MYSMMKDPENKAEIIPHSMVIKGKEAFLNNCPHLIDEMESPFDFAVTM
tara:strand:- start:1709 stop:1855 length:147 start_codon:yes stop_codon:yes gene_type:complete